MINGIFTDSNTTLVKVKYNKRLVQTAIDSIQIQHLLKLNCTGRIRRRRFTSNSNTTLVKVKCASTYNTFNYLVFKYNTC